MRILLLVIAIGLGMLHASACTMYKVTQAGRTMVGNNEDAWSLDARIWFERGAPGQHGAVYVGHRDGLPQGGMNDAGLVYDGLSVPAKAMHAQAGRTPMPEIFAFLKRILQECATVEDVRQLLTRYDRTSMRRSIILFVDRAGNHLVMEGDTVLTGNDATYVAGNFRPSLCTDQDSVPIPRFQQGRAFLAAHPDTSLRSCAGMMEAMKACRRKLGEGTLYTTIYDLQQGLIHLYFYHDFTQVRTFDLNAELAKGDHAFAIPPLFPPNAEYQRLQAYVTPFNTKAILVLLVCCALIAGASMLFFFIAVLRALFVRKAWRSSVPLWLSIVLASAVVIVLIVSLLWEQGIYYFGFTGALHDFPFPQVAYLPLMLLALALPLTWSVVRTWRKRTSSMWTRWMLTTQAAVQAVLIGFCLYWSILLP